VKSLKADSATLKQRLAICKQCEHLTLGRLPKTYRCGKCGCFIHIKAAYAKSQCPLGKWG
jgi:hypothetical protein